MKPGLLLLGATGLSGGHLLAQALEQGHEVTALVRDTGKMTVAHPRLRTVVGSATDPVVVDDALEGRNGVLCALGTRSPRSLISCSLMSDSMRALVPAMKRRGVSRLVLLSALGVGQSADDAPAMLRAAFRTVFRQVAKDKAAAEKHLRTSELDWTVVFPPTLTDDPPSGQYRAGESLDLNGMPKISRADVAHFMLAQLDDPTYSRKIAILSP